MLKKILLKIILAISKVIKIIKINSQTKSFQLDPYEKFSIEEKNESYLFFKKYFFNSIFLDKEEIRKYSVELSLKNIDTENDFFLEFGVWKGESINQISKILIEKKIYGFDSFEGLNEDWLGTKGYSKGTFKTNIPKVNDNVTLVKGRFNETIPKFINENKNMNIKFIHIDSDTYESTFLILKNLKKYFSKKTYLLFDDFYNFSGWKVGEFKALNENFSEDEITYKCFCSNHTSVLVEINTK